METCNKCKFWVAKADRPNAYGKCKRYPPKIIPVKDENGGLATVRFPGVLGGDWCGEFQPKRWLVGVEVTPAGEKYLYSDSQP